MKKIMKKLLPVLLVAFTMVTQGVAPASAAEEVPEITIETVQIGAIGNDPDGADFGHSDANQVGKGRVDYAYAIGTTEVTTAQYAAFLNAVAKTDTYGLYSELMSSVCGLTRSGGEGNWEYTASDPTKPVTGVTFWNALRFCNWLTNGQPEGAQNASTTEDGMYYLNGHTGSENIAVPRKLSGTGWALPSEDEWYKAAYYNTKGTETLDDDTYTLYATGGTITNDQANYGNSVKSTTEVGHYDPEQNGTYDMMGNVFEWTETATGAESQYRGVRGGSFYFSGYLASSARSSVYPGNESYNYGFRVSSLAVPEPSTYGILGGAAALLGAIALRRRNRRD